MTDLRPCPGCERHVRRDEETCPFCESTLPADEGPPRRWPASRLGRAAIMAFGVAAVTGGAALTPACGDDGSPDDGGAIDSGTSDAGRNDAGTNDAGTNDSGGFDSGMAMPYGAPPADLILV